jgi:hypothetical protein
MISYSALIVLKLDWIESNFKALIKKIFIQIQYFNKNRDVTFILKIFSTKICQ